MLRTTISKFKKACLLAHIPRILKSDVWQTPCNIGKLSTVLMTNHKSTATGSDDDKDCKKCKRLIELAFGPDKPDGDKNENCKIPVAETESVAQMVTPELRKTDLKEESKVAAENTQKLDPVGDNIINATKVEEEKIEGKDTNLNDINALNNENKCMRLIELAFGKNKPEHAEIKDVPKMPEVDTENVAQMVKPGEKFESAVKKEREPDSKQHFNLKLEKEQVKVSEEAVNINKTPVIKDKQIHYLLSDMDCSKTGYTGHTYKNIYEELAKRCLGSPDNKIDNYILKEMKELGVTRQNLGKMPNNPLLISKDNGEINQSPKNIFDKDKLNTGRQNVGNARTINHLTLNVGMGNENSDIPSSAKDRIKIKKTIKDAFGKLNFGADHEILIERKAPLKKLDKETIVKTFDGEIEKSDAVRSDTRKLNTEMREIVKLDVDRNVIEKLETVKPNIQHERVINCKETSLEPGLDIVIKGMRPMRRKKAQSVQSGSTALEEISEFRRDHVFNDNYTNRYEATPTIPQGPGQTLAQRLQALGYRVQQYVEYCRTGNDDFFKGEERSHSHYDPKIEKMLNDERIPRHLFAGLTIISKNVTTDTDIGRTLKTFYEDQDVEDETKLVKPERCQFYSLNADLDCKDNSQQSDPLVMIKECDVASKSHRNDHNSENYKSISGKMSDDSDKQKMYFSKKTTRNILDETATKMIDGQKSSRSGKTKDTSDEYMSYNDLPTEPPPTFDPKRVLIDPYGKNIKVGDCDEYKDNDKNPSAKFQEIEVKKMNESDKLTQKNRSPHLDVSIDPILSSPLVVNSSVGSGKTFNTKDSNQNLEKVYNLNKTAKPPQVDQAQQSLTHFVPSQPVSKTWLHDEEGATRCNVFIDAHEAIKQVNPMSRAHSAQAPEPNATEIPELKPEENVSLSEMLRRVRQRARLEAYRNDIMLASSVTKVETTEGSCKQPKPPCPPPQKTCPPSPTKCPPSNCPEAKPPSPKPCKPACPDPCATPKCPPPPKKDPCPPPPKKDPCAKFQKQDTIDILGLVVTLGVISHPEFVNQSKENPITKRHGLPCLPDIFLKIYALFNSVFTPDMKKKILMEFDEKYLCVTRSKTAVFLPKDYEPWTPIPSWPIPKKHEKKKVVFPQEGCKGRPPPPPGSRCNNIHHPCAGFPNDKKRT